MYIFIYIDKKKNYNLGQTFLEYNPILNPCSNYKYNKYIPEMHKLKSNNNEIKSTSPFIKVGQNVAY